MKTLFKTAFLVLCLLAQFIWAGRLSAQTLTTLHAFTSHNDGANPSGTLLQSSNTLYGAAFQGGASYDGTVFAINTDGTAFNVVSDLGTAGGGKIWAGAGLTQAGGVLYGTTVGGGTLVPTTVFSMKSDGTAFQVLYTFDGLTWGSRGALTLTNDTLYGTTFDGGSYGAGSVFALSTDGTSFSTLHEFSSLSVWTGAGTNSDGAQPVAGPLTLSGNTLYGTTRGGGIFGNGTLFAVNVDGTGFTNLHQFSGSDGSGPGGSLLLSGGTLFGTAGGGSNGAGLVFAMNIDGTGFRSLHQFTLYDGDGPSVILSGNTLYGSTGWGGGGFGTVFRMNLDGSGFTNLYVFAKGGGEAPPVTNGDGAEPNGLTLIGNSLFGTTSTSGRYGYGTIFKLSLPLPTLSILPSDSNVILSWPSDATGFVLQSATELTGGGDWQDSIATPTQTNGFNTVTLTCSNPAGFYRLRGP